jgi:hypothetical protein
MYPINLRTGNWKKEGEPSTYTLNTSYFYYYIVPFVISAIILFAIFVIINVPPGQPIEIDNITAIFNPSRLIK